MRIVSLIVLGVAAGCTLLELLFHMLPVSTSTAQDYYINDHILTYPPHHSFVASGGWDLRHPQRLRANNLGFVASRDFTANAAAVALIGDSFVEASMLDLEDRPGAQLESALVNRPVFAMGGPGSSLLDYAERVEYAAKHLNVRDFVVLLEEGDVQQAICGSGQIHGWCFDAPTNAVAAFRTPSAGTLKRVLRHSALAQYLAGQLKLRPEILISRRPWRSPPVLSHDVTASVSPDVTKRATDLERVIDAFFERISPYNKGHIILVLEDHTVSGSLRSELHAHGRRILMERAAKSGVVVLDTGSWFREFVSRTGLSVVVAPTDRHWNGAATGIMAKHVAAEILAAELHAESQSPTE